MKVGELRLQRDMLAVGAGDIAGSAGAGAGEVDRPVHGGKDVRVLTHAEIVVAAPDGDHGGAEPSRPRNNAAGNCPDASARVQRRSDSGHPAFISLMGSNSISR